MSGLSLPEGYAAGVHCEGLSGVDGLVVLQSGELVVCEELGGRISLVDLDGTIVPLVDSLTSPEGVLLYGERLLVVEDREGGRLVEVDSIGEISVLIDDLDFPEGIAAAGGRLYLTYSTAQAASTPFSVETGVLRWDGGAIDTVATLRYLHSFSGIASDADGNVYVCNELSGITSWNSVYRLESGAGPAAVFARGLFGCEGISFGPGGRFPALVAEESLGRGGGRLSLVHSDGSIETFATGFGTIEDVAVDGSGTVYVSEDDSGRVIRIEPQTASETYWPWGL